MSNTTDELDSDRLAAVVNGLADPVVVIDESGLIVWANRAAERFSGQASSAWIGRSGLDVIHPDDLELALISLETVRGKTAGSPIDVRIRTSNGWRLVELLGSPLGHGQLALVLRDLTERRKWEIAGDDITAFRSIMHNAPGLLVLLSRDGAVRSASPGITRILRQDPEMLRDRPFADVVAEDDRDRFREAFALALGNSAENGPGATLEAELCSRDGATVPFELNLVCLVDDPTVQGVLVSGHDITRLRIAQQALSELAHYDSLTGLLNRRSFDDALEREWLLAQRDGIDSFVVAADLDGFKAVNDRFGHAAGDDCLRKVSRALHDTVRNTDVLGRLGGDEFGVLLVRCGGEAAALGFVDRLREEMSRRAWPADATLGISCGYHSLRHSASPGGALHAADLAMLGQKLRK